MNTTASEVIAGKLTVLPLLALSARIHRSGYAYVNPYINEENFPIDVGMVSRVEYKLFNFNHRNVSSKEVIAEMDKEEFRPATLPELLAFGNERIELSEESPVIALGSVCKRSGGDRFVTGLFNMRGTRKLDTLWFMSRWSAFYSFLGIRKEKSETSLATS